MPDEVTHLENLEGLSVVTLRPGDKLVLRSRHLLTSVMLDDMTKRIQKLWPDVPALLVDSSFDVMVLRTETAVEAEKEPT